jgi:hypothetical protein
LARQQTGQQQVAGAAEVLNSALKVQDSIEQRSRQSGELSDDGVGRFHTLKIPKQHLADVLLGGTKPKSDDSFAIVEQRKKGELPTEWCARRQDGADCLIGCRLAGKDCKLSDCGTVESDQDRVRRELFGRGLSKREFRDALIGRENETVE